MAWRTAGFAHVWGVGAWLSASPRVQRILAAHVGVVLAAGVVAVVAHPPPALHTPLALAATVGSAEATVEPPTPPHEAPAIASRAAPAPRPRPTPQPRPKPKPKPTQHDWAYWASRIRGCESGGRPNAPPDYKAKNPTSSASGAYQIVDSTWAGRYGVVHAGDATPEQQEHVAAELYRRHGTADWAASAPCWRR